MLLKTPSCFWPWHPPHVSIAAQVAFRTHYYTILGGKVQRTEFSSCTVFSSPRIQWWTRHFASLWDSGSWERLWEASQSPGVYQWYASSFAKGLLVFLHLPLEGEDVDMYLSRSRHFCVLGTRWQCLHTWNTRGTLKWRTWVQRPVNSWK